MKPPREEPWAFRDVTQAKKRIEANREEALSVIEGRMRSVASDDYWSGYYDACRHALNAIEEAREQEAMYDGVLVGGRAEAQRKAELRELANGIRAEASERRRDHIGGIWRRMWRR